MIQAICQEKNHIFSKNGNSLTEIRFCAILKLQNKKGAVE